MNYNFVQREVRTLGEDLTELGESVIVKPEEPESGSLPAPYAVTPIPAILAELTCVQQRLSAVLSYIQGSSS